MKIVMILSSVAFIQLALCIDISDGYKCVSVQECAVALLSSKVNDLQRSGIESEAELLEVIEKYNDAYEKTKKMIETTHELIQRVSLGGVNEIDYDDADMLYCSTVNAVREILALNERLQVCVQEDSERNRLAQGSSELKGLLK